MQHLENNNGTGSRLPIIAESLYLINLMILPGIAFLVLLYVYIKYKNHSHELCRNHIKQAFWGSVLGGVFLIIFTSIIIIIGKPDYIGTWVVVILYSTCVHGAFIFFGALALSKALSDQPYYYPFLKHLKS